MEQLLGSTNRVEIAICNYVGAISRGDSKTTATISAWQWRNFGPFGSWPKHPKRVELHLLLAVFSFAVGSC